MLQVDLWYSRPPRLIVKLPASPAELGIVDPLPTFQGVWIPSYNEFGWHVAPGTAIPDVRGVVDLAREMCIRDRTKVMALAVAWQYFNAVAEGRDDYARTFLVVAPNVIVFERLRSDFQGGRIFRTDPIIPPELKIFWEMDFYMRGDPERASSQGCLLYTSRCV